VWNSRSALHGYAREQHWTDPGEMAAVDWVKAGCIDEPILDIGIGAGRTVPLLRGISADYVGIDYTASLLACAQERYPDVDLRHMDARDMSALPPDHFALAMFSCNGIDSVSYEDRAQIISQMKRVVRPGGYLLFSAHNRNGPGYGETILSLMPRFTFNPLKLGWRTLRMLPHVPRSSYNYWRHSKSNRDQDGHSVGICAAHDFGLIIVYMTLAGQRHQLDALGLELEAVFGCSDSSSISVDGDSTERWLHYVVRKGCVTSAASGPS
jgi:SAM-dependent methyltransferase